MQFNLITCPLEFEKLAVEWHRLAVPSPMQSHAWLSTWWECYASSRRQLAVVVARQGGELVGVAPWYGQRRFGRTALRWLADGHVASDHHTLLAAPGQRSQFATLLADWLVDQRPFAWHQLRLEAVDTPDAACQALVERLAGRHCPRVEQSEVGSCSVDLPADWETYLMQVSKNHRKRCRRWNKQYFDSGLATVDIATTASQCMSAWQTLVDLHNSRRAALGQRGAFHEFRFGDFHRRVIPRLAQSESVQLRILRIDGQPMAAEYLLVAPDCWYAYQSGLSPAGQEHAAGSLSVLATVRDAVAAGCTRLDLLRGDESYKFSWNAVRQPASTVTVRRPTPLARLATLGESTLLAAKSARRDLAKKFAKSPAHH